MGKRKKKAIYENTFEKELEKKSHTESNEFIKKDVIKYGLLFRNIQHEKESNRIEKAQEERINQIVKHYKTHANQYKNLKRVKINGLTFIEIPSFFIPGYKSKRLIGSKEIENKTTNFDLINGFLLFRNIKDQSGYVYEEQRKRMGDIIAILNPFNLAELKKIININPLKCLSITTIRNKEYIEIKSLVSLTDLQKIVTSLIKQKGNSQQQPSSNHILNQDLHDQKDWVQPNRSLPTQNLAYEPIGSMKPRKRNTIPNKQVNQTKSTSESRNHPPSKNQENAILANKQVESKEVDLKGGNKAGTLSPEKVTREVFTTKRSQNVVKTLKELYDDFCQICQIRIEVNIGEYTSEVHHIHPLSKNGPDIIGNTIVLCPNDHTMFDRGALTIDLITNTVIHVNPKNPINGSKLLLKHTINQDYIDFHNKNIFKKELI